MTDRPIIFSSAMVRALLADRKTQARRLATSPLARCAVGDRLYVRESFGRNTAPAGPQIAYRADHGDAAAVHRLNLGAGVVTLSVSRWTSSIHMPRWASRLTLIVEDVRVEPLQAISETDAIAEGVVWTEPTDADREWARGYAAENGGDAAIDGVWTVPGMPAVRGLSADVWHVTARGCYERLWNTLHAADGERWEDNPEVVALTFRLLRCNIEQVPA